MSAPSEDVQAAARIRRLWPVICGAVAIGLVGALGLILALRPGEPFAVDLAWMNEIAENRTPAGLAVALVLDQVGGGVIGSVVVPVVVVLLLLAFRRPWGALYFAVASVLSVTCVQLLKHTVGRARPSDLLAPVDMGSFPSGHTANAATMVVVLGILFPRVWVWAAGAAWALLMALSRTYLGVHWLSDTVGGLLLGAGVAVIVWAPLAYRLATESLRPHPFLRFRAGGERGRY